MKKRIPYILILILLFIIGVEAVKPHIVSHKAGGVCLKRVEVLKGDNIEQVLAGGDSWYVICHEHNLKGEKITIGDNSIIEFQGGCFTNGTIVGSETEIMAPLYGIFDTDIRFEGTFKNPTIYPEWFGAVGNDKKYEAQNTAAFNAACRAATGASNTTDVTEALKSINSITLSDKTYYVNGSINVPSAYFTIRSESDAIVGYVNHGMTTIKTSSKEPVLSLVDRPVNDQYFKGGVEKLVVENIKIEGAGKEVTSFGIGKENCEYVRDTKIHNVLVQHCRYGVYFDMPLESHVRTFYASNLSCRENVIGLYIKTDVDMGSRNKAWMNVNRFQDCYFTNNSIYGVVIGKMFNQSFNNVFDGCIVQDNGLGYTMEDYKEFGAGGINLVYGSADFNNCYFEGNYARRSESGNKLKEEATFVSNNAGTKRTQIEPKMLSKNEGSITCSGSSLNSINLNTCVVNYSHRLLCMNAGAPKININGGTFNNPFPINDKTSSAIVDYISNGEGPGANFGEVRLVCKNLVDLPSSTSFTNCVYKVNGSLGRAIKRNLINSSYVDIDVKGRSCFVNPVEYNNYGEFKDGVVFFIDPVNGNDKNIGTNPNSALQTIEPLYQENIYLPNNVHIIVIGNRNIESSVESVFKQKHKLKFSSYDDYLKKSE